MFDFEEIRTTDLKVFATSLISLLLRFRGMQNVFKQLAVCVSILAVDLPDLWEASLFSQLQLGLQGEKPVMFEVLKVTFI